ncbi:MAG: flagellar hook-associated protein FlgK [Pseudomonadota bacterium]
MVGLTAALYAANSSLTINARDIDVISRNIANTDTPGYTRKELARGNLVFGTQGAGVRSTGLTRFVPVELQRQFRFQTSITSSLDQQTTILSRIEIANGNPSDANSIGALMGEVEDAFRQVALEPDDNLLQQQVIQKLTRFTQEMNQYSDQIQEQRRQAELGIEETVQTVNELVSDIHLLSDQIVLVRAGGDDSSELEDQRDALTDLLAEEIDISYYQETNGRLIISLADGKTLLEQQPFPLKFTRRNVTPQAFYNPATPAPAPGSGLLGGVILDLPDGGPDLDVTSSFGAGKLGALLKMRDESLPQAQAQLDELAANLMVRFGSLRDGQPDASIAIYQILNDPGDTLVPSATAQNYADAAAEGGVNNDFDFVALGPPFSTSTVGNNQEVGLAGRIEISNDFANNLFRVREGRFFQLSPNEGAPDVNGDPQFLPNDSSLIQRVIDEVFEANTVDLSGANFSGGAGPTNFTYRVRDVGASDNLNTRLDDVSSVEDYTNSIIAFQANVLDDLNNQLDAEGFIETQVENELKGVSGVNIDQELARLIEVEAAYSASGQIISTIRDLFDELLAII